MKPTIICAPEITYKGRIELERLKILLSDLTEGHVTTGPPSGDSSLVPAIKIPKPIILFHELWIVIRIEEVDTGDDIQSGGPVSLLVLEFIDEVCEH